jgi:hypothetical protein
MRRAQLGSEARAEGHGDSFRVLVSNIRDDLCHIMRAPPAQRFSHAIMTYETSDS